MAWLLVLGAYTVLGLLFASQAWLDYAYAGRPIGWPRAVGVALTEWYVWALFTPAIVWLARRVRFVRGRVLRALAVHLPVAAACTVAKVVADTLAAGAITGTPRGPFSFIKVHVTFLTYWAIVAVTYGVEHYRSSRERQIRAAQLETELARAQVQALRVQIQPHFLFNTLNAIAALIRDDVEAADAMIARLAELLRATLATADAAQVPLRREIELVQMYLDIQQARIGDRLAVVISADERALDTPVPTLLLQPLVENAIRHGTAVRAGPVRVEIRAQRQNGTIEIDVEDDGPGFAAAVREGQGLHNTRARLAAAYAGEAALDLLRGRLGGALARVRIPA